MKRGLIFVSVGFLLSRLFYFLIGIRFLGLENLNVYLQFIDPPLLKHDLLGSLYYSSFPPLYNLLVGVMLKCFGESAAAFAVLHLLTGWALALVLFALMTDLGIGPRLAGAATLVFLALPPAILYENWFFYTYMETLLFALAAWSFLRFVRQPGARWGCVLFSCASALALLNARMMFYVLIIALASGWAWWRRGRMPGLARTAAISAAPVLLVVAVMAKNAWLFGAFTVDPHFGFHMGNGFIYAAWQDPETNAVCQRDYPLLLLPPTKFPDAAQAGLEPPAPTGVPLLDDPLRSGGQPNFNSRYYLQVSRMYTADLADFITRHPWLYAKFVGRAFGNYWEPSDQYVYFPNANREVLGAFGDCYDVAYPLLLVLYLAGAVYALRAGWPSRWADPKAATLGFMLLTVAYNMLAIFVTYSENDRYKFTIEPLLWIMMVYALHQLGAIWRRRKIGWPGGMEMDA
jgi:4-amino-4-deoxy-L-arabinose transferase-like glycosyltransferase